MRMISDDARRDLSSIRDGLTDEAYADAIWVRREMTQGPKLRPHWKWPLTFKTEPLPKPLNFSELKALYRKVKP